MYTYVYKLYKLIRLYLCTYEYIICILKHISYVCYEIVPHRKVRRLYSKSHQHDMYISAINENNNHEFEADQGSIYGKVWKEVKVWLYYNLSK